jgi:hypothetical protein
LKAVGFCISGWSGEPLAGDGASIAKLSVMSGAGDTISDEVLSGLDAPSTITIVSTDDEPAVDYGDGTDSTGCYEAEIPVTNYIGVGRSMTFVIGLKGDFDSSVGVDFSSFYSIYRYTE